MSPITRNRMKELGDLNVEDIPDFPVERRTRRSIYIKSHDGETVICRRKSLSPVCSDKKNVTTPTKNNKITTALNSENLNDKEETPERLPRLRSYSTSKKSASSFVNKATCDSSCALQSSPQRNLKSHSIFDSSCTTENNTKFKRNLNRDLFKSVISSLSDSDIESENEATSLKSKNKKLSKMSEDNCTQLVGNKNNNKTTTALNDENVNDDEGTPKKSSPKSRSCSTSKKTASSIVNKATSDSSPLRNLRSCSVFDGPCTIENDAKFKRNLNGDLSNSEISSLSDSDIKSEHEMTFVNIKNKKLGRISEENCSQLVGNTISESLEDDEPLITLKNKLESFERILHDLAVVENNETYDKNDNLKQNVKELDGESVSSNERAKYCFKKRIINLEKLKECESSSNNLDSNCEDVPRDKILEGREKILETLSIGQKNLNRGLSEMPEGDTNSKQEDDNEMHQVGETNREPREDGSSPVCSENMSSEVDQYNIDSKAYERNLSKVHSENGSSKVFCEDDVSDVPSEADTIKLCHDNDSSKVHREDDCSGKHGEEHVNEMHARDVTREVQSEDITRKVQSEDITRKVLSEDINREVQKVHQVIGDAHPRCNDVNEEHICLHFSPEESEVNSDERCIENKMHSTANVSDDENNCPPSTQRHMTKYCSDDSENAEGEEMNAISKSDVLERNANFVTNGVNVEDKRDQGFQPVIDRNRDLTNDSEEENITSNIMKGDAGDGHYQITELPKKRKSYEIAEVVSGIYDGNETAERKILEKEGKENEIETEGEKDEKEDEKEEEDNMEDEEEEEDMEDEEEEEDDMEDEEEEEDIEDDDEEDMEDEEEEEETDNRRSRRSRALQFIDVEAEEGETDYEDEDEEEECEEEEDYDDDCDDNYRESESEENCADINMRDFARKFLNDEAIDEDQLKKKRKRILIIESDEEEDYPSMKELSTDNKDTSSVEGRKEKAKKDSQSPLNKNIEPNSVVHYDDNLDDHQEKENKVTKSLNVLDISDTVQKIGESSGRDKDPGESLSKLSVVKEDEDQEGVLERSYESHSIKYSKADVRVMEIAVANKRTDFNEGNKSLFEEICKETQMTEVKFNDKDIQRKDETSEIFIKDSIEELRADSNVSKKNGKDKVKKKNKHNKDCALNLKVLKDYKIPDEELTSEKTGKELLVPEKKHEPMGSNLQSSKALGKKLKKHSKNKLDENIDDNEKSKSESYKSEIMLKTSKKSTKKIKIAVCNKKETDFEKDKCYIKEILDTEIIGLESNDENIYKNEDRVRTSVNSVKKQREVSDKLENIGEEKILKKRKHSHEYAVSEVLKNKTPDKMLTSPQKPEKEFVIPEKKQKLMRSDVENIMTSGKKVGKFAKSNLGESLAVDENIIVQNDKAINIPVETSSSKSARTSLEVKNMFQVNSLKNQIHQQLAGMLTCTEKIRGKCVERKRTKRDVYRKIAKYVAISNKWIVTDVSLRESEKFPVVWDIQDIKEPKGKRTYFWNGSNWVVDDIYVPSNSKWIVTNNIRKKKKKGLC